MPITSLILPGLYDSGPDHWQSIWERIDPTCVRVVQRDWERPKRSEWVDTLTEAIATSTSDVVLVGHSTGCLLVAFWAAHIAVEAPALLRRVRGALLVAPSDPDSARYPEGPEGFTPVPRVPLPFPSIVAASTTDEYVTAVQAERFAAWWGSRFVNIGDAGHINGESGLGLWPAGRGLLEDLRRGPSRDVGDDQSLTFHWLDAVATPSLLQVARDLMGEYAAMPHTTGRWHTPAADIAALPFPFTPPSGAMAVAFEAHEPVACGCLLEFAPGIAEMKRVYVRPTARGRGIGERLCRELIWHASLGGYRRVYLDTAPELQEARALYARLGFTPIPPYRQGLLPDTLCYALDLPA